ncbi:MAG: pyrroloquinoline quinone biosynthesis peptide chaperone PqqD [Gammaproteobacteria bacterium]|nr:pyrroloquinoline quinone biosynthesis peptide chaperone PqqD [Gammaproteobacteria bacterium]
MPDQSLDAVFKLKPTHRLQWEPAQKCDVLLYAEGMVTLNPSASEILKHLDGSRDLRTVINDLERKFDATGLEEDVLEFVHSARERGWITAVQD